MGKITVEQIKALREVTDAGIIECKKALEEAGGDQQKAVQLLRKRGLALAQKKAMRKASEGIIYAYIHPPGKIGAMVELNCETDFVARNEKFQQLAKELAMHIAAMEPRYLSREKVPEEVVKQEIELYKEQALNEGKSPEIAEKIAQGKLERFYATYCLLEQAWARDPELTIDELIKENIGSIKENIVLRRFMRFVVGELDEQ